METTMLTIHVRQNTKAILEEKAKNDGKDFVEYVEDLLEKDAGRPKTIDEILAPFRREVEASEITDEEFDNLIEEVREEIHQEKLAKQRE
jgi:cobyric acid synthase